jgi:outer membrane receptor protein involved in Fe transport
MQRQATGSKSLKSEKSDNYSFGFSVEPLDGLTVTLDYWSIEKEDTIGLFGEENHVLVDLVLRLEAGTSNCATVVGNPAVGRDAPTTDPVEVQGFLDAGLCPVGEVTFVADQYANLDTRTIKGHDIGVYYDFDTGFGDFRLRYNGAFYDKYEQLGTGAATTAILEAKAANPSIVYPIAGIGDLINFEGNQDQKHSASVSWRLNDWGASLTGMKLGAFYDILSTGARYEIPSMTTYNAKVDYSFEVFGTDSRVLLGINNFTDERAPLADSSYGFFQDAHRDWGRYFYLDLRISFNPS